MIDGSVLYQMTFAMKVSVLFGIFMFRAFLFAGGGMIFVHFAKFARHRMVVRTLPTAGWFQRDFLRSVLIALLDAVVVAAFMHFDWLRLQTYESVAPSVLTFLGMFVWFEIYFYYTHRWMHFPKLFWMHRHHHVSVVTTPWSSLSFSFAERAVLLMGGIGIPAMVSQISPLGLKGFAYYFILNYVLNVNGHLNVDVFPRRLMKSFAGEFATTTTHHALHHLRYRGNFGLYSRCLDRLHGTEFDDYLACQALVSTGRGVQR